MKVPETARYSSEARNAIQEIASHIEGESDDRGMRTPHQLTHTEIVDCALLDLADVAERHPEVVVRALVDARLDHK